MNSLIAEQLLKNSDAKVDPATILFIIQLLIKILMFLGDKWKDPSALPLWKKLVIKAELIKKFGLRKGLALERAIYNIVPKLTNQEVKGFVEVS